MNNKIKKLALISTVLVITTIISVANLFIKILSNENIEIIVISLLINQVITYNFGYYFSRFSIVNFINEKLKAKSDKEQLYKILKQYIK